MSSAAALQRPRGGISNEFFAMVLVIVAEVMFFGGLASAYTVLRTGAVTWRPPQTPDLVSALSIGNSVILFLSGIAVALAWRAVRRDDPAMFKFYLGTGLALGLVFVGIQGYELARLHRVVPMDGSLFGSIFYTYVGLHAAHVLGGVVLLVRVFVNALRGAYHRYRHAGVMAAAIYWLFVVAVWAFIYLALYVY